MPRERRKFKRESFIREVQKLFVIATEGSKTEYQYFEEFKSAEYYNNKSVFVEILNRSTTNSSPASVIKQLNAFKKEFHLKEGDELWMVIDRDKQSWSNKQLADVARECIQKGFGFALSNPCFEVWLLLHRKDYKSYSEQEKIDLFKNNKSGSRNRIEIELVKICHSYNKSNLNVKHYLPYIQDAIINAEKLVANEKERWPNHFGSHVFKLVRKLLP
jgi:hypothetical protein